MLLHLLLSPVYIFLIVIGIQHLRWRSGQCLWGKHQNKKYVSMEVSNWCQRNNTHSYLNYMIHTSRWHCDNCDEIGLTIIDSREKRGLWKVEHGQLVPDGKLWSNDDCKDLAETDYAPEWAASRWRAKGVEVVTKTGAGWLSDDERKKAKKNPIK